MQRRVRRFVRLVFVTFLTVALALSEAFATTSDAPRVTARPVTGIDRYFPSPDRPRFQGGWLFDHAARELLHARSADGERTASTASDVLLAAMIAAPFTSALGYGAPLGPSSVASLMGLNLSSLAFTFTVTLGLKVLVARERPYATAAGLSTYCADRAHRESQVCNTDRNASFLSGHAAAAFTGAGLICAHSAVLGQNTSWDALPCGVAMTVAATTAMLRIVSDRHYATDTLAGMALGLTSGLLFPIVLHLSDGAPLPLAIPIHQARSDDRARFPLPVFASAAVGLGIGVTLPLMFGAVTHRERNHRLPFSPSAVRRFSLRSLQVTPSFDTASVGVGWATVF